MKKIIIIKTGDAFSEVVKEYGDFEEWIINSLKTDSSNVRVVDAKRGESLPEVKECRSVVIAGSHDMVTENLDWSMKIESWVPDLVEKEIPLIGICYGHQLIAKAMGGKVDYHPEGIELGTVEIETNQNCESDSLFKDLPDIFKAHVSHSQSVIDLPPDAVLLAGNSFERHHAFRIGKSAWGVQFHPEYNESIQKSYIKSLADLAQEIKTKEKNLIDNVQATLAASSIMERFGRL